VEKFFGEKRTVRSIDLQLLEEYQEERRKQISPTMKKAVTARTVNYELRL
jgi:flagellar biosynthesis chaperone FliJ